MAEKALRWVFMFMLCCLVVSGTLFVSRVAADSLITDESRAIASTVYLGYESRSANVLTSAVSGFRGMINWASEALVCLFTFKQPAQPEISTTFSPPADSSGVSASPKIPPPQNQSTSNNPVISVQVGFQGGSVTVPVTTIVRKGVVTGNMVLPTTSNVVVTPMTEQTAMSRAEIEEKLNQLNNALSSKIYAVSASVGVNATQNNNVYRNLIAPAYNIDILTRVILDNPTVTTGTFTNPTVIGGTLNNVSISGSSFAGTSGTFSGDVAIQGILSASNSFVTQNEAKAAYFTATSTTATSTFTGGFAVQTDRFVVESGSGNVGIGSTSPQAKFAIAGQPNSVAPLFLISTSTSQSTSTALVVTSSGNIGIGTSSPVFSLSVAGDINITGSLYQNGAAANFSNWTTTGAHIYRASNVGIGSTTPSSALSVGGNSYVSGSSFFGGAITATSTLNVSGLSTLGYASTTQISSTGSSYFATLGGNVGLGTTTPAARLEVVGTTAAFETAPAMWLSDTFSNIGTRNWAIANGWGESAYGSLGFHVGSARGAPLQPGVNGVAVLLLDRDGSVGIGVSSPSAKLDVAGSGFFNGNLTATNLVATGTLSVAGVATFSFASTTQVSSTGSSYFATLGGNVGVGTTSPWGLLSVEQGSTGPVFVVSDEGTSTPSLIVAGNGNVGIGTANPMAKLEVSGTAGVNNPEISITAPVSGTPVLSLIGANSGILPIIGYQGILRFATVTGVGTAGFSEKVRMTNDGNLGIGTTTPTNTLGVQGTGYFSGSLFAGGAITATSTLSVTGLTTLGNASTTQISSTNAAYFATSGGNVGIGTTSPTTILNVFSGTETANGIALDSNISSGNSARLFFSNGNDVGNSFTILKEGLGSTAALNFRYNATVGTGSGTNALSILDGGNVGIGTTTPLSKLSVNGTAGAPSSSGGGSEGIFRISEAPISGAVMDFGTNGGNYGWIRMTNSTDYTANYPLVLNPLGGNIGIGTTVPGSPLHVLAIPLVQADARASILVVDTTTAAQGVGGGISFGGKYSAAGFTADIFSFINGIKENATDGNFSSSLVFGTRIHGGSPTERMRIGSTGNVGIGCADPDNILEIGGTGAGCNTGVGSYFVAGGTTFTANSSREWKENISTYSVPNILEKIKNTPARTFDWKVEYSNSPTRINNLGFIAEEFYGVLGRGDDKHVNGQDIMVAEWLALQNIASVINLTSAPTTTPTLYITASSTIAIGTSTPDTSYALYVNGDAAATSFVNISTREQKHDIEYLDDSDRRSITDRIRNIKVATYYYNGENCGSSTNYKLPTTNCSPRLGLIAEEAPEEILSANKKGVDVYKLATFILAGVQEQDKRITGLELRIANLEQLLSVSKPSGTGSLIDVAAIATKELIDSLGVTVFTKINSTLGIFERAEIGTAAISNGLEMNDVATDSIYCVRIKNGEWDKQIGICGTNETNTDTVGTAVSILGTNNPRQTTNNSQPTTNNGGETGNADTVPPVITITGANPAEIVKGAMYIDLGATVSDNVDHNLGVRTNGEFATSIVGTYIIYYTATDQAGNIATTTRAVKVFELPIGGVEPITGESATSTPGIGGGEMNTTAQ